MPDLGRYTMNDVMAKKACEYARTHILMGSTQLVNNSYDLEQRRSLVKAIEDIRFLRERERNFSLEFDVVIQKFYHVINLCRKFSLGNCYELALMALDYVIRYAPDTHAEVFQIKGGDHAFLVIGRKKGSIHSEPETWGDEAYICDPWANKYFPARYYLAMVENYYFEKDLQSNVFINRTQSFSPERHKLTPVKNMNTDYLRRACTEAHRNCMFTLYIRKSQALLGSIQNLEGTLVELALRLSDKYGMDNEKRRVVLQICEQLQVTRTIIWKNMNTLNNPSDYLKFATALEHRLQDNLMAFRQSLVLSDNDKKVLNKYQLKHSWKTRIIRFFGIPPESVRVINGAVEVAREDISKLIKRK